MERGATQVEVARLLGVGGPTTIKRWRAAHAEFAEAFKVGKDLADERVVSSLYSRAIGTADTPPDVTACIFWLKNRRPAEWRDVRAVDHSGTLTHRHVEELTTEQLYIELQRARAAERDPAPETGDRADGKVH
jgi:hypothetical protein